MVSSKNHENNFDVQAFLKTLPKKPGIYQMFAQDGELLYVGKANQLKNRVSSYFQQKSHSSKTESLVKQIQSITITVTHSESEALLLEQNLIKQHRPRYNILLRDDKSYPYIFLSSEDEFPQLAYHRGAKRRKGHYYGPYPSAHAVRDSLNLLQKLFKIRQCSNTFFNNRTRPCLQYQIKRCSAPCVGLIDENSYSQDVKHTQLFIEGKNQLVIDALVKRMEQAAHAKNYEQAAHFRDQIISMRKIQEQQYVTGTKGDVDIMCAMIEKNLVCVAVLFIRAGRMLGSRTFYPQTPQKVTIEEVLTAFIPQFYLSKLHHQDIPRVIVANADISDKTCLEDVLSDHSQHKVQVINRVRGERAQWLKMAKTNALQALQAKLADRESQAHRFDALRAALQLDSVPQRIECFDISHNMGEATVASCVVFDRQGPLKSDYRRYNIKNIQAGDDYAAIYQAVLRRFTHLKKGEGKIPDVVFIDGGKGQLASAHAALTELQVSAFCLVGVAKGRSRKPGLETLFINDAKSPLHLATDSPALHLIQHIRDEAHRFAISGHRGQRDKKRRESTLEAIPGIGPKKRRALLQYMGGLAQIKHARIEELVKVPGISLALAQQIYDALHGE